MIVEVRLGVALEGQDSALYLLSAPEEVDPDLARAHLSEGGEARHLHYLCRYPLRRLDQHRLIVMVGMRLGVAFAGEDSASLPRLVLREHL